MAGLTQGEKIHWRDRIAARIEQRIETLVAAQDPTLLQRVTEDARKKAFESLGIAPHQKELEALHKQEEEMQRREKRLYAEQRALINGTTPEEELEHGYSCYGGHDDRVEAAVKARAKVHEGEILAACELGRQVVALRQEEDNLLDTVWLATSSIQIKELWEEVNALLAVQPTELEKKALQIAPVEDKE